MLSVGNEMKVESSTSLSLPSFSPATLTMSAQPDSKKRKASSSSSSSSVAPITTALLKDGLASLPADSFWDLVSSSLLPHLNSLPSSEIDKIRSSFQDAIDERENVNTIDFENRESEMQEKLNEFTTSVDTKWKQEADEQVSFAPSLTSAASFSS